MGRFRLTKAAKILLVGVVAAGVAGGAYVGVKSGFIELDKKPAKQEVTNKVEMSKPAVKDDRTTINLSLDEWVGWKSIVDANQGLTTQPGSIFDELGLNVNISIINDATDSSNALIKGDLDAAGYTTNRLAFLSNKFADAGEEVVVPVYTNYSNGGDGIIAKDHIQSVDDLVDAKIGVPQFSEAHTLVAWFVQNSDLTEEQQAEIMNNLILFDTPDDAAKAFFAGQVDVACTWQPYLSQAEEMAGGHILFDTTTSSKLIMDCIVFDKDFAEMNAETVTKFIDGVLQAESMYTIEFNAIRDVMPMFSAESDDSIKAAAADADLAGYKENIEILKVDAPMVYQDMCEIWTYLGETVDASMATDLFDTSYIEPLKEKYSSTVENEEKFEMTEEQQISAKEATALLKKSCTINFVTDTANFLDSTEAAATLKEFVEIAQVLDGAVITIEGNINSASYLDEEAGRILSENRANTVKKFMVANGIDPNRIIVIGNGATKMIADPSGADAHLNRRTDISFVTLEG